MEVPAITQLAIEGCTAQLSDESQPTDLEILLYTGAPVARSFGQMVFDLGGMEIPGKQVPLLFAHDPERPIGFADPSEISTQGALRVSGTLLTNEDALKVVRDAQAGLQWQASMGVRVLEARLVGENEVLSVNGREFSDGVLVTKSRLLEGSVLTLGADGETKSQIFNVSDEMVPVAGQEESMSIENDAQGDVRGDLAAFLGAFSADRKGWAAEQFANGRSLVECLTEENQRLSSEAADQAERLANVASAGYDGTPSPATELAEINTNVDLSVYGASLERMSIGDVEELVAEEFKALSPAQRAEFATVNGFGRADYAACRKHEALGHVRVSWDSGRGF